MPPRLVLPAFLALLIAVRVAGGPGLGAPTLARDLEREGWERWDSGRWSLVEDPSDTPEIRARMAAAVERNRRLLAGVFPEAFPGSLALDEEIELYTRLPQSQDEAGRTPTERVRGRMLDYGTYKLLVTAQGRRVVASPWVKSWKRPSDDETRAAPRRPALPDLDVTYIERLPRYAGDHGQVDYSPTAIRLRSPNPDPVLPAPGTPCTYRGHITNAGGKRTGAFRYRWLVDGVEAGSGRHARGLAPGEEFVAELRRPWSDAETRLALVVEPEDPSRREISRGNNRLEDYLRAKGFTIWIPRSERPAYAAVPNMLGTWSFEDWVQQHFRVWNFLLQDSVHPATPEGSRERVRVDRIVLLDHLPESPEGGRELEAARKAGGPRIRDEGAWGFSRWDRLPWRMARMDWGFIHEMGHQLGLIDWYHLFAHPGKMQVVDGSGARVRRTRAFPEPRSMMCWHGPHRFHEVDAAALDAQLDRHRGYYGDYNFRLPDRTELLLVDMGGAPVQGAEVRVYPRDPRQRYPAAPESRLVSDAEGVVVLPNRPVPPKDTGLFQLRPNPFGDFDVVGSQRGVLLLEVAGRGSREFHFLDFFMLARAAYRGARVRARFRVATRIPVPGAPAPPSGGHFRWVGHREQELTLEGPPAPGVTRLRVYQRSERKAASERVPELVKEFVVAESSPPYRCRLRLEHGRTHLYLTALDAAGRESAARELLVPDLEGGFKVAVTPAGDLFVSNEHPHAGALIRRDPGGAWRDWDFVEGPEGRTWTRGLATDAEGRLWITAGAAPEVRVVESSGELIERIQDARLKGALDVAVDPEGRAYVLGTETSQVVVVGEDHSVRGLLGATRGKLSGPRGLTLRRDGTLVVCDTGNDRVLLVDPQKDRLLRTVDEVPQPQDAVEGPDGRLYLAVKGGVWALSRDLGQVFEYREGEQGPLGDPTGLAFDASGRLITVQPWRGFRTLVVGEE